MTGIQMTPACQCAPLHVLADPRPARALAVAYFTRSELHASTRTSWALELTDYDLEDRSRDHREVEGEF